MGNPAEGNFWGYDNYWENAGYVGVWALLMVGLALTNLKSQTRVPQMRLHGFFGAAAIVSLFFALGRFLPFFPLLYKVISGAALFQGPARLLSVYTLAVAALAGIGTEQLLDSDRWRALGKQLAGCFGGRAACGDSRGDIHRHPSCLCSTCDSIRRDAGRVRRVFGVSACRLQERRFGLWQAALVGVVAVDLLVSDWRLNPTTEASVYRAPTASAQAVRAAGEGRALLVRRR